MTSRTTCELGETILTHQSRITPNTPSLTLSEACHALCRLQLYNKRGHFLRYKSRLSRFCTIQFGMQELIIEAGGSERTYWRDLWRYRDLFYFLAWRDLLVRYKQTVVGVIWSVARPFLTMVVLTIAFGKVAGLSSGSVPY